MKEEKTNKWKTVTFSALLFIVIWLLTAFVVTVSFILFFTFTASKLTLGEVWESALLNLGNTFFITLIFWIVDSVRRKLTVEKPVNQIVEGLEKITKGNFDTRIQPMKMQSSNNQYNVIISYINQLAAELEGVETLRTDFVSNVSHEMKTPLSVIRNYTELLYATDLTDEERNEYLDAISNSTDGLAEMISNILKLNKLENQQIFPENRLYDLSTQIVECLLGFELKFEEKNIEIEADIEEEVKVKADEQLLVLVWNNLFSNAVKFTDNGGTITIKLKKDTDYVVITISDTGCGMNNETISHIFDKFYQGDTSHASKGNGLGLALAKRVVDISDGEISVTSQIGQGSTFTVKLKNNV